MVLLAFQSTGSETGDLEQIEARLTANKKVVVKVTGYQEAVLQQLRTLFGQKAVGALKRLSQDPITLAEEWQCELHRDLSKLGNHSKEREREEKRRKIMQAERHNPLTAEGFANKLKAATATLALDSFDPTKISKTMIRTWEEKFIRMVDEEEGFKHVRGIVAEKVVPIWLRQELEELLATVEVMYASDIDIKDNGIRVGEGEDPDQVVFHRDDGTGHFWAYMELDALFRTATLKEYVAFDVTTDPNKPMRYEQRTEKLYNLSKALDTEIMLIDICLTNKNFAYAKKAPNIYRWDLPCALNFHELIGKIVPATLEQRLWGQTIGRRS